MNSISKISRRIIKTNQFSSILLGVGMMFALPCSGEASLSLKQALELTLKQNSVLQTYPLAIRGTEALRLQAEVTPNPVLTIEVENALGSGDYQSFDTSEINFVYSQLVELGNKQQSRINFANAETKRLQSEYQLTRLDILAETSRRFYQNILLQRENSWFERKIASEQRALQTTKRRAKAGALGKADVSNMALRVARSEVQQQALSFEIKRAQIRLASMWVDEPNFSRVSGSFDRLPRLPDRTTILEAIEKIPSFLHHIALQRLSDSKLKLAQSNGQSDMTFKVGLKQHQRTSDQSLNIAFSMPLAFENPNRGRIRAAQISVERALMESELHKKQLELSLLEIYQNLINLYTQAETHQKKLLPLAKTLLAETERGFEKGRYTVSQWIDAQSELFTIEQSIINIHWQVYQQVLELERITGQPMTRISEQRAGEAQ